MISPFASKSGTNYCPSDEEVLEIQRLLVQPLSRLKAIDDKIAELQKTIEELTEERDSEIFVACLPTHRDSVMSAVEACSPGPHLQLVENRIAARAIHASSSYYRAWRAPAGEACATAS
ncbi:hypothetical protein C8F04DRAFT_1232587 [Mycena alexandri]|uniref:Uncharacterized protein n=1 Tax=Mycena alexandri TaxID=1745969 RepID=A0AAD6X5K9_9AGAR|nr:hypothetical protein C8F04DRAFT_1232587 [Mycena alexandri]